MIKKPKTVVLLSGGMDSVTVMAIAKELNYDIYALTIQYGQKHIRELQYAYYNAQKCNTIDHRIIHIPRLTGSSLTGEGDIPDKKEEGIPNTFVPARNIIFLALATNYAITMGAGSIHIGINNVDYSGYPDCHPEFIKAMETALCRGTDSMIKIISPLMNMTKVQIIQEGIRLGVNYGETWTCYEGRERACGVCPACRIRLKAFDDCGIKDDLKYEIVR